MNRIAKIESHRYAPTLADLIDAQGNRVGGLQVSGIDHVSADGLLSEIVGRWPGLPEAPSQEPGPRAPKELAPGWSHILFGRSFNKCAEDRCRNGVEFRADTATAHAGYCRQHAEERGAFGVPASPTPPEPPTEPAFWLVCKPAGVRLSTREAAVAEARKLAEKTGSDFHIFRAERAVRVAYSAPVIEEIPLGEIE